MPGRATNGTLITTYVASTTFQQKIECRVIANRRVKKNPLCRKLNSIIV